MHVFRVLLLMHGPIATASVPRFLNRLLGIPFTEQSKIFEYFMKTLNQLIDLEKETGKYDTGILGLDQI